MLMIGLCSHPTGMYLTDLTFIEEGVWFSIILHIVVTTSPFRSTPSDCFSSSFRFLLVACWCATGNPATLQDGRMINFVKRRQTSGVISEIQLRFLKNMKKVLVGINFASLRNCCLPIRLSLFLFVIPLLFVTFNVVKVQTYRFFAFFALFLLSSLPSLCLNHPLLCFFLLLCRQYQHTPYCLEVVNSIRDYINNLDDHNLGEEVMSTQCSICSHERHNMQLLFPLLLQLLLFCLAGLFFVCVSRISRRISPSFCRDILSLLWRALMCACRRYPITILIELLRSYFFSSPQQLYRVSLQREGRQGATPAKKAKAGEGERDETIDIHRDV